MNHVDSLASGQEPLYERPPPNLDREAAVGVEKATPVTRHLQGAEDLVEEDVVDLHDMAIATLLLTLEPEGDLHFLLREWMRHFRCGDFPGQLPRQEHLRAVKNLGDDARCTVRQASAWLLEEKKQCTTLAFPRRSLHCPLTILKRTSLESMTGEKTTWYSKTPVPCSTASRT